LGFGAGNESSLHPEAAAGVGGVGGDSGCAAEEGLGDLARGRLAEGSADITTGTGAVEGNGFAEESGLISEGGVEAGTVDAHGGSEGGQGRALVAVLPEDAHCGFEGYFAAKGAGTTGTGFGGQGCG
jgi:hypothetical protein